MTVTKLNFVIFLWTITRSNRRIPSIWVHIW